MTATALFNIFFTLICFSTFSYVATSQNWICHPESRLSRISLLIENAAFGAFRFTICYKHAFSRIPSATLSWPFSICHAFRIGATFSWHLFCVSGVTLRWPFIQFSWCHLYPALLLFATVPPLVGAFSHVHILEWCHLYLALLLLGTVPPLVGAFSFPQLRYWCHLKMSLICLLLPLRGRHKLLVCHFTIRYFADNEFLSQPVHIIILSRFFYPCPVVKRHISPLVPIRQASPSDHISSTDGKWMSAYRSKKRERQKW